MIVLDTDVLIEIFDRKSAVGEEILGKIEGYKVATTSINLHEIVYGFYRGCPTIIQQQIIIPAHI